MSSTGRKIGWFGNSFRWVCRHCGQTTIHFKGEPGLYKIGPIYLEWSPTGVVEATNPKWTR